MKNHTRKGAKKKEVSWWWRCYECDVNFSSLFFFISGVFFFFKMRKKIFPPSQSWHVWEKKNMRKSFFFGLLKGEEIHKIWDFPCHNFLKIFLHDFGVPFCFWAGVWSLKNSRTWFLIRFERFSILVKFSAS